VVEMPSAERSIQLYGVINSIILQKGEIRLGYHIHVKWISTGCVELVHKQALIGLSNDKLGIYV
jgi:hypothetical protein